MLAALYVQRNGTYYNTPGIDPWDEARDARNYNGPHPVIAHPPCSRWCMLAGLVQARWGHKVGDDGGCFEAALRAVRTYGGVLEHPAYSKAWKAFSLPRPHRDGGWYGDESSGFSCHVEQIRYGHRARKATWLYMSGIPKALLPELAWGQGEVRPDMLVSWCGNRGDSRPRIGKLEASQTPTAFKAVLVSLAELARTS